VSHEVDLDTSLRSVRVGTEASIKLGDQSVLTFRLPNDTVPAAITLVVVRLTTGLVDRLVLKRLAQLSRKRLTAYNKAAGLTKEKTTWKI
jgi:hypothetical protein